MTMIAIAASKDAAHVMTDSVSYTRGCGQLGRTSKVMVFPHMDAAMTTQGDQQFGAVARAAIFALTKNAANFDGVLRAAPALLLSLWEDDLEDRDQAGDVAVFIVGRSEEKGRYVAFGFDAASDFEPFKINGLFVIPSPWTMRPSKLELERYKEYMDDPGKAEHAARLWQGKPPAQVPRTVDEWRDLAMMVREQRALEVHAKVLVAGKVFHTVLTPGSIATTCIHEYDDSGEEFNRLVAATNHPIGVVGACPCGSGTRYLDCCMAPRLDEPCWCHSGRPTRDCCGAGQVLAEETATAEPATA